ncbi:hypothetical protein CC1G_06539 [Coprinopsis cinerea okayama7|uniref:Fork-head domain-containing protein n=1 Tax=Coprinopsis cinerea (strain Okayama-7 / 130 / ATCC MYA-4618 / FGSC 9003) TaxID=240176 RepID=A8N2V7_COPC7|nr:hypothetical protein CC1G_06539 [Coprinopsis cinerea okayama7\|eukprot:XP_001829202.2 hypothetical protein CC1G_06539 [Coprinopsis cinerea okayama7\
MSDLSNILNPENSRNRSHVVPIPETVGFANPSPHAPAHQERSAPVQRSNAQKHYDHAPHPDCPDTLACLPDTDGRPQHTLPVILRCAILGSPRKRLTIREIYAAMEEKYSYYKTAGPTWKQSVRHHLSLNRLFERQPRPVTDPGFGSYWTVNLSAPPGTKRPRKRGRGNKDANASQNNAAQIGAAAVASPAPIPASTPIHGPPSAVLHQGPSRHPIVMNGHPVSMVPSIPSPTLLRAAPPPISMAVKPESFGEPSQRPGRLRKSSNARGSTPLSSHDGEDDDESIRYGDAPPESGDDYDSEEGSMNGQGGPYDRRDSLGITPYPPPRSAQMFSLPPITSLDKSASSSSDNVVERLQNEIDTLRRQSAEAVSVSLRLSEQLSQAQAEVSRSRAAVRDLEDMLHSETLRRKDLEQQLAAKESGRYSNVEKFLAGPPCSPDRIRQTS